jgi:DNA (cytosine-5)-methyltransferase 1
MQPRKRGLSFGNWRHIEMKVLNLYAGIGGNRKLWTDVEVTAVEYNDSVAKVYKEFFPDDKVVVGDAIQYLLKHYEEFDFIWASPPCQSHSKTRFIGLTREKSKYPAVLPDFKLYSIIKFLEYHFDGYWVVENVKPYYDVLIQPSVILDRHYFWANFDIPKINLKKDVIINETSGSTVRWGIDVTEYSFSSITKATVVRNCVNPEIGKHIFDFAMYAKDIDYFKKTAQTRLF